MRVLVVNAGSSSLKLSILRDDELIAARELVADRGRVDVDELRSAVDALGRPDAVGHRIVHGGERHVGPAIIDTDVVQELRRLTDLAPLHQPTSLAALDAVSRLLPGVPSVACFDTAFHATLPLAARTYALPAAWRSRFGLRRYGFHGLSHAYAARRAAELLGRPAVGLRLITCHLGAGVSLAAVRDGASIETTMGFTPLEGLVMATRSGSVDPGLVLWLLQHGGLTPDEVAHGLEHDSGLLGLAGTGDMRELLARDDDDADLAIAVYVHRLRAHIGAMAAALDGVDALVFTGGVGERAPVLRERTLDGLTSLGATLDVAHNTAPVGDTDVSAAGSPVRVLVVHAREDLEIAGQVRSVLGTA